MGADAQGLHLGQDAALSLNIRARRAGLPRAAAALLALGLAPAPAFAHGFGRLYTLPVPFWLYAWAAGAALILSFLLAAVFATAPDAARAASERRLAPPRRLGPVLRTLSVFALLLCIATGLFGSRDPYHNFSMTFFWVVFLLAGSYLAALVGDFYAPLNPWRAMVAMIERLRPGFARGRRAWPEALGDWPALALYLGFVWFELFGHGRPLSLGLALLGYTALNLAAAWWFGAQAWFRHGEFFALFFRLIGQMAPLTWRGRGALARRAPGAGLIHERPQHLSTVLFVLAMLSTTAFDGLRATQGWVGLVWNDPGGWLSALLGQKPIMIYPKLLPWYFAWESLCLFASPFLYFAAYGLCLALARCLARSTRPLRELTLDFAYPLLPIALVYNLSHYATLLLSQGPKILSLLSDPFGWRWNLFGTEWMFRAPILPPMSWVWHGQVAVILLGHVAGIACAHAVALRVFPTRRAALASQVPMLALMVAFTVAGLWILAQPLTAMLMRG